MEEGFPLDLRLTIMARHTMWHNVSVPAFVCRQFIARTLLHGPHSGLDPGDPRCVIFMDETDDLTFEPGISPKHASERMSSGEKTAAERTSSINRLQTGNCHGHGILRLGGQIYHHSGSCLVRQISCPHPINA